MKGQLGGKVALVTGSGSGIGRASAMAMGAAGATIAVCDLVEDRGVDVVDEIERQGGQAFFIQADATQEEQVKALVERILVHAGRLDLALNNVGGGEAGGTIVTMEYEGWESVLNVNLTATWLAMKYEIPAMAQGGGGAIINMASQAGIAPMMPASPAYSAAKAGIIHLTRYAARAHAEQGIRVNAVAPGLTRTPQVSRWFNEERIAEIVAETQYIARALEPEEVAQSFVFLMSEGAAMITGETLAVCGGSR